jgi:hypothetical protein
LPERGRCDIRCKGRHNPAARVQRRFAPYVGDIAVAGVTPIIFRATEDNRELRIVSTLPSRVRQSMGPMIGASPGLIEASRLLVDDTLFHHKDYVVHRTNVFQRVSFDGDYVGELLGLDCSQAIVDLQQAGRFERGRLNGPHR